MDTQIIITQDTTGKHWVSGRSLVKAISHHKGKEIQFNGWANNRVSRYRLTEKDDYVVNYKSPNPNYKVIQNSQQFIKDILFSVDIAITLARLDSCEQVVKSLNGIKLTVESGHYLKSGHLVDQTLKSLRPGVVIEASPAKAPEASQVQTPQFDHDLPKSDLPKLAISINTNRDLGLSISARELYKLISPSASNPRDMYHDWIHTRIEKFNLVEDVDYVVLTRNTGYISTSGKALYDHIVTLGAAKSFCIFQFKKAGIPVLNYINEYEAQSVRQESLTEPASALGDTPAESEITAKSNVVSVDSTDAGSSNDAAPVSPETAVLVGEHTEQTEIKFGLQSESPLLTIMERAAQAVQKPQPPRTALQELLQRVEDAANVEETIMAHEAMLDDHQTRLVAMETKVDALVNFFRQAALVLVGELPVGPPPAAPAPVATADPQEEHMTLEPLLLEEAPVEAHVPLTPRAVLVQHVRDFVAHTKIDHEELWRHLYKRLFETTGFNVSKHKLQSDKSYMNVVVRHNQLENLIAIVTTELLPKMGVSVG